MKKLFIKAWLAALFMLLMCRPSFAEDIYKFTSVCGYNGEIYCNYSPAIGGVINEDICKPLPYGMHDLGWICSFTIYDGYIYYMTSEMGTDVLPASIYRCNMDGSNNVLIADDAHNYSECYIADDALYYTSCYFVGYTPEKYDISCVNLNNLSRKTVLTDTSYEINLWDGKYIFFSKEFGGDYCRSDKNGKNICRMSENDVEIFSDIIYGGYGYKLYDGAVYRYDWSGNSKWMFNTARWFNGYRLLCGPDSGHEVENIIDGKAYYTVHPTWSWDEYTQNILLCRCNLDGTKHELVGAMYHP